jgi:hypothetical protein
VRQPNVLDERPGRGIDRRLRPSGIMGDHRHIRQFLEWRRAIATIAGETRQSGAGGAAIHSLGSHLPSTRRMSLINLPQRHQNALRLAAGYAPVGASAISAHRT